MKVIIDARELIQERVTGIGRYLSNFLTYGVKSRPGWSFILLGNERTHYSIKSKNLRAVTIKEGYTFLWDQIRSLSFIRKERPDIYFSPYYKFPLLTRVKTFVTVHDLIEFIFPEYDRSTVYRWMFKLCLRKAYRIITVSQSSKGDLERIFRIHSEKILVSHNVVDFPRSNDREQAGALERYGIDGEYILYVGNFNAHKNVTVLIQAYIRLPALLKERIHLVLAGGEPEGLSGKMRTEGLILPGHIDEKDLSALYSNAALFVFPSFYEGFGLPPLEAMSYGVPVIASKRPAMSEILGDAAQFFDPDNARELAALMERLLTSKEDKEHLRKKGMAQARRYGIKENAEIILNAMEAAITA